MGNRCAIIVKLIALAAVVGLGLSSCSPESIETYTELAEAPKISPNYSGCTIPANIAPLNFHVLQEGAAYAVTVRGDQGREIHVSSDDGDIRLPSRPWRALLDANKGRAIHFDVYVRDERGAWKKFLPIVNTVAPEGIDDVLVYRFMKPIYNWWKEISVHQRNLTNYEDDVVLHGRSYGGGCLNCHSFVGNTPDTMSLGLRSAEYGSATLLVRNGSVDKIGAKWGYTAWHPSGELAVYSINKVRQFFHPGGMEVRDVVDLDSALACYSVKNKNITCPPALSEKDRLETYPTWSPDGKFLYYCSGPILWEDRDTVPPKNYEKLRYDLRRIAYDIETHTWGQVETVLAAEQTGLSILLPRISPDGRFLLFCMCRYGCFPVYQPSSDLYLMDLATGQYRKLDINSDYSESWHSWSSNSRWFAFSSKRLGGAFTRTFVSHVDGTGRVGKPFIVPQEDPTYYDALLRTCNTPELVKGKVTAGKVSMVRRVRSPATIDVRIPITAASPKAKKLHPWQERE